MHIKVSFKLIVVVSEFDTIGADDEDFLVAAISDFFIASTRLSPLAVVLCFAAGALSLVGRMRSFPYSEERGERR